MRLPRSTRLVSAFTRLSSLRNIVAGASPLLCWMPFGMTPLSSVCRRRAVEKLPSPNRSTPEPGSQTVWDPLTCGLQDRLTLRSGLMFVQNCVLHRAALLLSSFVREDEHGRVCVAADHAWLDSFELLLDTLADSVAELRPNSHQIHSDWNEPAPTSLRETIRAHFLEMLVIYSPNWLSVRWWLEFAARRDTSREFMLHLHDHGVHRLLSIAAERVKKAEAKGRSSRPADASSPYYFLLENLLWRELSEQLHLFLLRTRPMHWGLAPRLPHVLARLVASFLHPRAGASFNPGIAKATLPRLRCSSCGNPLLQAVLQAAVPELEFPRLQPQSDSYDLSLDLPCLIALGDRKYCGEFAIAHDSTGLHLILDRAYMPEPQPCSSRCPVAPPDLATLWQRVPVLAARYLPVPLFEGNACWGCRYRDSDERNGLMGNPWHIQLTRRPASVPLRTLLNQWHRELSASSAAFQQRVDRLRAALIRLMHEWHEAGFCCGTMCERIEASHTG